MKKSKSGIVFGILFFMLLGGTFYGAWFFGNIYDNIKSVYNEELSKSQLLNQSTQNSITSLMEENAKLKHELESLKQKIVEAKAVPAPSATPDITTEQRRAKAD